MDDKTKVTPKTSNQTEKSFEVLPLPRRNGFSTSSAYTIKAKELVERYKPKDANVGRAVFWLLVILLVGFGGGWLGANARTNQLGYSNLQTKEIVSNDNQLTAAIAGDVDPSVVSVDATGQTETQDIFGFSQPSQEESEGTGIIISSSGYILTNRHVIPQGTTSVSVVLNDGTTINNVQVVGTTSQDDPLDIAILKINNPPEALQPALLGNSGNVQIGDSVVAIGNALGQFQNTVTSGIISGRGRSIQASDSSGVESEDLQDLFQTDAAINEGNSGGPLVNIKGQVIGIDTAVAQQAQNIGFAIPINDAEGIIKGVLDTGKVERPYLGVYYVTLNSSVAKQYSVSQTNGAYIPSNQSGQPSIISGSPAANAGLQVGDIITAVNGSQINADNSLSSLIDQNEVGSKVNLTIIRNGNQKTVTITVGQEPASVNS